MKCLVCGDEAVEQPQVRGHRSISCPSCGDYQLSDGLQFMLELSRCSFHVRQTRRRLKEKVARGLEPVLTVGDNDLLRFD